MIHAVVTKLFQVFRIVTGRADLLTVATCWLIAYWLRFHVSAGVFVAPGEPRPADYLAVLPAILWIWWSLQHLLDMFPGTWQRSYLNRLISVVTVATCTSGIVFFLLRVAFASHDYSRAVIGMFWVFSLVATGVLRTASTPQATRALLAATGKRIVLAMASVSRELTVVAVCWLAAYFARFYLVGPPLVTGEVPGVGAYLLALPIILLIWLATFLLLDRRRADGAGTYLGSWLRVVSISGISGLTIYGLARSIFLSHHYSRTVIAYSIVLSLFAVGLLREETSERAGRGFGPAHRLARRIRPFLVSAFCYPVRESPRRELVLAAITIAVLATHYLYIGINTGFLPCSLDCGETYESHIGALNLYRFGFGYAGGLQDFAAGAAREAHPTLYTHNPNIGMYFMYLLALLGIHDVHVQAALGVIPFGVGLVYMYLFVRAVTRRGILAALCLMNAAIMYPLVMHWAFQPLRAFSWLLTFAPAYHLYRYSRARNQRRRHLIAGGCFTGLSLGVDYPFALFEGLSLLGFAVSGIIAVRWRQMVGILAVSFGIPFLLRQIQVAAVVGAGFWALDVVYSIARRLMPARFVVSVPDEASLRALYAARNVLKWPDPSAFDPGDWIRKIVFAYTAVLGVWFWAIVIAGVVAAIAVRRLEARGILRCGGGGPLVLARVIVVLVGAQAVTFGVFGGYLAIFYGIVMGPLLAHWIVLLLGLATYILAGNARRILDLRRQAVPVGAVLLVVFVALRVGTEVRNHLVLQPRGYPGREILHHMKGESVVTFWISSSVATYTRQWAAVLYDPRVVDARELPFEPDRDYYFFFEADKRNVVYRTPSFLFVPGVNVGWLHNFHCEPFGGRVATYIDGCVDLDAVRKRFDWLPLYARGDGYLIYDLRSVYGRASSVPSTAHIANPTIRTYGSASR